MQQQKQETTDSSTTGAHAQPACQNCGNCPRAEPAPAPIHWERKRADDTEGGEL